MSSAKSSSASKVRLQIASGKANPAPPVGTVLGPRGINIMSFCKAFNDLTKDNDGAIVTAIISINKDKTFTFIVKSSPVSFLIKKKAALKSGSKEPGRSVVGSISHADAVEIAKIKLKDTNANSLEEVVTMVIGSARSMGIDVV